MPLRQQRRVRWMSAWILAVLYMAMGIAYFFPDELVRNPNRQLRSSKDSVIVFIENLTVIPFWGVAFLIAGISLAVALWFGKKNQDKYTPIPLLFGGVVFVMYGFAGWSTAIINPGTYVTGAMLSSGVAALSLSLMYSYSQRPTLITLRELEIEEEKELEAKKKEGEGRTNAP